MATSCGLVYFNVNPLPLRDAVWKQKTIFYRMPFGNRKKYQGLFQFSIVTILKIISSLWKPKIQLLRHFLKLKIAYFSGKTPFNFSQAKFYSKKLWAVMG